MNTTSHLALTGEALRLRLVELLAPTCGMETPATARAAYDFVVGEIHHGATPRVEIRVDPPTEPLTRPGWTPTPVEAEPKPKPVIPTVSWSAETLIQLERLYASGLPQTAIAEQLKMAPHQVKKALSASADIKARWPRNAAGIPTQPPYPVDAPWPPPADWASAAEPAADARTRFQKYPEIEPEPEAVPEPGTVKARLLELCRQGLELSEINAALGWSGSSASAKIATYKFSVLYREARARRRAEKAAAPRPGAEEQAAPPKQQEAKPRVKTEASIIAKRVDEVIDKLHKPVLPEDRLRRADDPAMCPCDIETVENWMEGQGLKLTLEGPGIYTCEGTPMTAAQLVKRANRARMAVSLPAFDVRGI